MSSEVKLKTLEVDWDEVGEFYFGAKGIPDYLELLASDNQDERLEAFEVVSEAIYHQGTIYPNSVNVMPVLHEILRLEKPTEKDEVLVLLRLLVSGSSYHDVHQHLEIHRERAKTVKWQKAIADELKLVKAIYQSAAENIDLYLSFLSNKLKENRLRATHLIAFLPEIKAKSLSEIFKAVERENDVDVRANLYITAECLAEKNDIDFFTDAWKTETDLLCKMLALRTHLLLAEENCSQEEYDALFEMLIQCEQNTYEKFSDLPFGRDLSETITEVLIKTGKDKDEKLLKWYLTQAKDKAEFSENFAFGLFNVAFGGIPEQPIEYGDLTDLQKEAVLAVARQAFPKVGFYRYSLINVLDDFKLPFAYKKLCQYLGSKLWKV